MSNTKSIGVSFKRTRPVPLDESSVFTGTTAADDAAAYAKGGTSYVGQLITVDGKIDTVVLNTEKTKKTLLGGIKAATIEADTIKVTKLESTTQEQTKVGADTIILRDGKLTSLGGGEYAGIIVNKGLPTTSSALLLDNTRSAYISAVNYDDENNITVNNPQKILTCNPNSLSYSNDGCLLFWNYTDKTMKPSKIKETKDGITVNSGLTVSSGVTVSNGTTSVKALNATTGTFGGEVSAVKLTSSNGLDVTSGKTYIKDLSVNGTVNITEAGDKTTISSSSISTYGGNFDGNVVVGDYDLEERKGRGVTLDNSGDIIASNNINCSALYTENKNFAFNVDSNGVVLYTTNSGDEPVLSINDDPDIYTEGPVLAFSGNVVVGDLDGSHTKITSSDVTAGDKSLSNCICYNDALHTNNYFGGAPLYISKIDDALYAADKRFSVTLKYYKKADGKIDEAPTGLDKSYMNPSNLFDGTYDESSYIKIPSTHYAVLTIECPWYISSYSYGDIYVSFYNRSHNASVTGKVMSDFENEEHFGEHDITFEDQKIYTSIGRIVAAHQKYHNVKTYEITITPKGDEAVTVTEVSMRLDRQGTTSPIVSKHRPETLYYPLTVPEVITQKVSTGRGWQPVTAEISNGNVQGYSLPAGANKCYLFEFMYQGYTTYVFARTDGSSKVGAQYAAMYVSKTNTSLYCQVSMFERANGSREILLEIQNSGSSFAPGAFNVNYLEMPLPS